MENDRLLDEVYNEMLEQKANVSKNIFNYIPFPLPNYRKAIPGFIPGTYFLITAGSGVGKTQFTKFLLFESFYESKKINKNIQVLYFALEESKEEFVLNLMSFYLYKFYEISLSLYDLKSEGYDLPDEVIAILEKDKPLINEMLSKFEIIDSVFNPTGIWRRVQEYAIKAGQIYYYNYVKDKSKKNIITYDEYLLLPNKENYAISHYEKKDDTLTFVVVDHYSLLSTERDSETLHKAMSLMSATYMRKYITKVFKFVGIGVQQQAAEGEKQEYTRLGETIESKLEPSAANLADNKLTYRDCHICLGLYNPNKHRLPLYDKYKIRHFGDHFRALLLLKNRYGKFIPKLYLFMKGSPNYFEELPDVKHIDDNWYNTTLNEKIRQGVL